MRAIALIRDWTIAPASRSTELVDERLQREWNGGWEVEVGEEVVEVVEVVVVAVAAAAPVTRMCSRCFSADSRWRSELRSASARTSKVS